MLRREAQLLCQGLRGEELTDGFVGFDVGGGIGAGASADRILVDEFDAFDLIGIAREADEIAGCIGHVAQESFQGGVENAFDECRLARPTHARHHGEHVEGELHVDAAQIVHPCTFHLDREVPGAATGCGRRDFLRSREIGHGMTARVFPGGIRRELGGGAFEDDFAAEPTGIGADVDEMVGLAENLLVVLYYDDGVADGDEMAQNVDEPMGVATVQTDARLVEDVERAHERTAQGGGQLDALAFAAAERVGGAVEGEVVQTDVEEELQTGVDFGKQSVGNSCIVAFELQL